tara:strand:+ start:1140 stop:1403 length:264 start_codon:yes stop_codon:yes gene_type:complete
MQYVYILRSKKDGTLYTGCTHDVSERLKLHNAKRVASTTNRIPLELIYYEAYLHKDDAFRREKFLKTGWGRNYIKKTLQAVLQKQKN